MDKSVNNPFKKSFREVSKNDLQHFVWPKSMWFQKIEAIMNLDQLLEMYKLNYLLVFLRFHYKVVAKVFFKEIEIFQEYNFYGYIFF